MKVFISVDIEGICSTTTWEETRTQTTEWIPHAKQMTREVLATIEGALAGGATKIVVKDAHGWGQNIFQEELPEGVTLLRRRSGHPYLMVEGIDSSFDAAMFVGYHAAASRPGNPLSHTLTGRPLWIKVNGRIASEFLLYSWACALEGVPSVLLSGDAMLCDDEKDLHPGLFTVAAKDADGALTKNFSRICVEKDLRNAAEQAIQQDLKAARIMLPESFHVEIMYKEHVDAAKASYFPGVVREASNVVSFSTTNYRDVLTALSWIV
ncbi:MAG: M55 family metallopeptidase [Limnochordia bacterium]|nr:M55 family metallopeptidase [Limnochordia bacterium]